MHAECAAGHRRESHDAVGMRESQMATTTAGLRDVIAAASAICNVNGAEGKLSYFGYDIQDLAEHATFEEVIYLLWYGDLPRPQQLADLTHALQAEAALPMEALTLLEAFPASATPMTVLRTTISALAMYDS